MRYRRQVSTLKGIVNFLMKLLHFYNTIDHYYGIMHDLTPFPSRGSIYAAIIKYPLFCFL